MWCVMSECGLLSGGGPSLRHVGCGPSLSHVSLYISLVLSHVSLYTSLVYFQDVVQVSEGSLVYTLHSIR